MREGQKLTKGQRALLERLQHGALLVGYCVPGIDKVSWYIERPYSNEDARTVNSALARGWLTSEGGGLYVISPAGRQALEALDRGVSK